MRGRWCFILGWTLGLTVAKIAATLGYFHGWAL